MIFCCVFLDKCKRFMVNYCMWGFFLSLQGPNSVFSLPLESKKPMKLEDVPLVRI